MLRQFAAVEPGQHDRTARMACQAIERIGVLDLAALAKRLDEALRITEFADDPLSRRLNRQTVEVGYMSSRVVRCAGALGRVIVHERSIPFREGPADHGPTE